MRGWLPSLPLNWAHRWSDAHKRRSSPAKTIYEHKPWEPNESQEDEPNRSWLAMLLLCMWSGNNAHFKPLCHPDWFKEQLNPSKNHWNQIKAWRLPLLVFSVPGNSPFYCSTYSRMFLMTRWRWQGSPSPSSTQIPGSITKTFFLAQMSWGDPQSLE